MAKIAEYTAPNVDLRPSDLGFSATETAGRRLGQEYNEAAQNIRQVGTDVLDASKLTAQVIEEQRFIFELRNPNTAARKAAAAKGGSVKVSGLGKGSGWPWDNQPDLNASSPFKPDSDVGSKVPSADPGGQYIDVNKTLLHNSLEQQAINGPYFNTSGPLNDLTAKLAGTYGDNSIDMQPPTPLENLPPAALVPNGIPGDTTEANSVAQPDANAMSLQSQVAMSDAGDDMGNLGGGIVGE